MGTDAFGRDAGETGAQRIAAPALGLRANASGRRIPGWLVALALGVLSLGGTALVLVRAERAHLDDPLEQARRGEITNLGSRSFLRAERLSTAYVRATRGLAAGEVVTQLTIAPVGVQVLLRDPRAFQRIRRVDAALELETLSAGRSEAVGVRPAAVALAGVEPAARRVLARIPERTANIAGVRMTLVLVDGSAKQSEWRIDVTDVRPRDASWYARADGTRVRRSDEPPELTR